MAKQDLNIILDSCNTGADVYIGYNFTSLSYAAKLGAILRNSLNSMGASDVNINITAPNGYAEWYGIGQDHVSDTSLNFGPYNWQYLHF